MIGGFDISTSVIGYTILDNLGNISTINHINLSKIKDFWEKAEVATEELTKICVDWSLNYLFVEEPKQTFSFGGSSAWTLSTLIKFNGICSFWLKKMSGNTPVFVAESHARKMCGIKLISKKKGGGPYKEQTFEQVTKFPEFKNKVWELKKTGKIKDYHYDEVDSYIIAKSGFLEFVSN